MGKLLFNKGKGFKLYTTKCQSGIFVINLMKNKNIHHSQLLKHNKLFKNNSFTFFVKYTLQYKNVAHKVNITVKLHILLFSTCI